MQKFPVSLALAVLFLFAAFPAVPSQAQVTQEDLAQRVTKAQFAFRDFQRDARMTWFRQNVRYAKGLLIMPVLLKGGFFVGGSGGKGVLLAQDSAGTWSHPAFYDVASGSFGLQFGAAGGQVILMIMTERGLRRFLRDKFQLGAEASIGMGPEEDRSQGRDLRHFLVRPHPGTVRGRGHRGWSRGHQPGRQPNLLRAAQGLASRHPAPAKVQERAGRPSHQDTHRGVA